jgi:phosphodiesterase/alkaline phosphatase D-like protein
VVWTRYTPMTVDETVTLELRMAAVDSTLAAEDHLDPSKNPKLRRALIKVTSATDFIAKVDVKDLPSNSDFVFAFLGKSREWKSAFKWRKSKRDVLTRTFSLLI